MEWWWFLDIMLVDCFCSTSWSQKSTCNLFSLGAFHRFFGELKNDVWHLAPRNTFLAQDVWQLMDQHHRGHQGIIACLNNNQKKSGCFMLFVPKKLFLIFSNCFLSFEPTISYGDGCFLSSTFKLEGLGTLLSHLMGRIHLLLSAWITRGSTAKVVLFGAVFVWIFYNDLCFDS